MRSSSSAARLLATIPNLPHEASRSAGAADNVEVRTSGRAARRSISTPKAHWDLGPALGILDFERATKISGARFAVLMGAGARLERALINFMLDLHTREHGYTEVQPPFLVNAATLYGTGQAAEVRAGSVQDRRREGSLSDSDRRSAGHEHPSRRDSRRPSAAAQVHRLHAVFSQRSRLVRRGRARADPPASVRQGRAREVHDARDVYDELEELTADAEEGAAAARTCRTARVLLCTGDMGFASAKTYDIEVWLPGQTDLPGDFLLLELRGVPGAPREYPVPAEGTGKPSSSTP